MRRQSNPIFYPWRRVEITLTQLRALFLILLRHITDLSGNSLKLLFGIGGIDGGLAFLMAHVHLPHHFVNADVASR